MPRISNGWWCAGVGGGVASLGRLSEVDASGHPVVKEEWDNAGGTCWVRPGVALFQHGAHLESYDVATTHHDEMVDPQGCYELAAGGDVYAAQFNDGVRVSNQGTTRYPLYGVGDVSPDGNVILLRPDGTVDGFNKVPAPGSVQALENGAFIALDAGYRPWAYSVTAPTALPGRIFGLREHGDLCVYHTEQGGRLVLQERDALRGTVLVEGLADCHRPDFEVQSDGTIIVMYATKQSEAPWELRLLKAWRADFKPLTPYVPPPLPTPDPVGPRSEPLLSSTAIYDLLSYVKGREETFPRKGPTHPMHQVVKNNELIFFVKFGVDLPAPYVPGEAYEMWAWDSNWIYHLEDASAEPYSFADSRWFPRKMMIGQSPRFEVKDDEIVFHNRVTCERRRTPAARRMWLHAVYPKFYWGQDLGERETIVVAYDPTAGQDLANRSVELGFYALGAGAVRWQSFHADQVYPHGYDKEASFPPAAMWAQSDFYLFGGPALQAKRTGCVGDTVPHYLPWDPNPPVPPPSKNFTHTKGLKMNIDGKTVVLRGPKGMLMRPDKPGTGIWKDADPKGSWRGSVFDIGDANDARAHYRAEKLLSGRYLFTNIQDNCLAGEDAGQYSPDLLQQFYHKPTGNKDAGDLEQWRVYDGNENGAIEAQCEQTTDNGHPSGAGKKFFAYPLCVEVI